MHKREIRWLKILLIAFLILPNTAYGKDKNISSKKINISEKIQKSNLPNEKKFNLRSFKEKKLGAKALELQKTPAEKLRNFEGAVVTTYIYDTADRLTDCINKKSGGTLISSYHYILDANGNRISVEETTPEGSKTTSYAYDELNCLTRTAYPDGTEVAYIYDGAGNRLTMTTNGETLNYQYDEDNRLIQAGDEIYLYDKMTNAATLQRKFLPERQQNMNTIMKTGS